MSKPEYVDWTLYVYTLKETISALIFKSIDTNCDGLPIWINSIFYLNHLHRIVP